MNLLRRILDWIVEFSVKLFKAILNNFATFWKRYFYSGLVVLIFAIIIAVSANPIKAELEDLVDQEPNFTMEDEINEESVVGLVNADKILLLGTEVEFRGEMVDFMYYFAGITMILGVAGLVIEIKSE